MMILAAGCGKPLTPTPTDLIEPLPSRTPSDQSAVPSTSTLPEGTNASAGSLPTHRVPSVAEAAAGLSGLDFDTFVNDAYLALLQRNPELLTSLALSASFGMRDDLLTDISDAYIRETQSLEGTILELLQGYDRAGLTGEQQLTCDIFAWYLQDRIAGHAFMYDDYPLNITVFSVHNDLLQFFTDIHPVTNLQNAQDYVTRLWQVDTKMAQLIDGLQRRQQAGVVLPGFLLDWVLSEIQSMASSTAQRTQYYSAYAEKLAAVTAIGADEKDALLAEAELAINDTVLPGYQALAAYLGELRLVATNEEGVWKFPDGQAYYTYLLSHYTTINLSAEEINTLGLQELERIHTEMRALFARLGYPADGSLPELYNRLASDGGLVSNTEIVATYEQIIREADAEVASAFDLLPSVGVIVMGGPTGGYYMPPALDGSRPGMFYAQNTGSIPWYTMPTLAYHEAIPGHHFQIAISQHLDLPAIRQASEFTAYVEGWALYAERLVWELGFYEDDPYGDLGRLQMEAFRAARLVVDTRLHAQGWSFDQAVDFMVENTGRPRDAMQYEVSRYCAIPGQATSYYIGYLRILALRQQMMEAQGEAFDLREFHNILLGNGAMPLDLLTQVIEGRLAGQ